MNLPRLSCFVFLNIGLVAMLGCGDSKQKLDKQIVETSCGMCQFGQIDQKGCHINIRLGQKVLPVVGAPKLTMEEMHAPGSYCVAIRKARVSGTIDQDRFLASSWDLLPLEEDTPIFPAGH